MSKKVIETLKETVENSVNAYLTAYNGHKETQKKLKTLKKQVSDDVNTYNLELSKETYRDWNALGDPVKTAIRTRFIPRTLSVTFKVNEDTDTMTATMVYRSDSYRADLPTMQTVLGPEVFAKTNWFAKCEKLAFIIAKNLNDRICEVKSTAFDYIIKDASKLFDFEGIDLNTEEGAIAALQEVMDSILFIPGEDGKNLIKANVRTVNGKPCASAWTVIRESMTREGPSIGTVAISSTGKMSSLIADAMYTIMTNGDFALVTDNK